MASDSLGRAAQLLSRLESSFATRFSLWSPTEGWLATSLVVTEDRIDDSTFLATLSRGTPTVVPTGQPGESLLFLPIPWGHRKSWLAIGKFGHLSSEWIERMAQQFVEVHRLSNKCHDLEEQLTAAMSQISADFEQQTYLRFLAEQIELCDVTRDITHVVDRVLPRLQRVISASSLVFVPSVAREHGPQAAGWVSLGTPPLPKRQCLELIEQFDAQLFRGPVVRNQGFRAGSAELPASVVNFMMAAVEKESSSVGWMLAFNRLPGYVAENEIDNGFGTVEAGLLQVTSIMVATHGRNVELFQESEDLTVEAVRTLVSAIDARDSYTRGHSERVGLLGRRLARELSLSRDDCEQIYVAGLLHDIGKIGISDQILRKEGRLSVEEFDEIKKHPVIGFEILRGLGKLSYVLPGVLHHHERVDGTGYPHGLAGEEIPFQARILAVADSWDAMTSARPYRQAMAFEQAEQILEQGAGSQWDPAILAAFRRMIEEARAIALSHASMTDKPPASTTRALLPAEAVP